jgi:hypothetical protein
MLRVQGTAGNERNVGGQCRSCKIPAWQFHADALLGLALAVRAERVLAVIDIASTPAI